MKKERIHSFKDSIRKTFTVYALIPSLIFTVAVFLTVIVIFLGSVRSRTCNVADQTSQGLEQILSGYMTELEVRCQNEDMSSAVQKGFVHSE